MKAGFQNKILFLGFGSIISRVEIEDEQDLYLKVLKRWLKPQCTEEIKSYFLDNNYSSTSVERTISTIVKNNYVMDFDSYDKEERFSRNHLFFNLSGADPKTVQDKLKMAHVLILGCGGIGNLISVSLATSGVGKLTLLDDDMIELSNLTRQFLFKRADIGHKKTMALKRELLARVEDVKIDTFEEKASYAILESIKNVDLIVLSADSQDCLPLVNQFCSEKEVPYINIGYVQDVAIWGPFYIPGLTGCVYCQDILANNKGVNEKFQDNLKAINSQHQAPSNGAVNMLSASLGLLDILKFLGEFGAVHSKNKRVGLWTHNLAFEQQDCSINMACLFCANGSVKSL